MTFKELGLTDSLLAGIDSMGYKTATPVQSQVIQPILAGKDIIASAQTGTGKTAAFLLPIVNKIITEPHDENKINALIIVPTRELAIQIADNMEGLGYFTNVSCIAVYGGGDGNSFTAEKTALTSGCDIVVCTPGRMIAHLNMGYVNLKEVKYLVLDEADRMLDMGFADDIQAIAKQSPASRQTLLFSATYPDTIAALSARLMRQAQMVKVDTTHDTHAIDEWFFEVEPDTRLDAVTRLLSHYQPASTVAFCNTRVQCNDLVQILRAHGFSALTLHGDLDQRDRDQVLIQFANQSCSVLVATDVAARGLDIAELAAVINVDTTPDPQVYTHRIGRTGRAGATGLALSLVTMSEMSRVARIEEANNRPSRWAKLSELSSKGGALKAPMRTLQIAGGRKEKIRAGDILGALTGEAGFDKAQIGKISLGEFSSYVAVSADIATPAMDALNAGRIKGKRVKVRLLDN